MGQYHLRVSNWKPPADSSLAASIHDIHTHTCTHPTGSTIFLASSKTSWAWRAGCCQRTAPALGVCIKTHAQHRNHPEDPAVATSHPAWVNKKSVRRQARHVCAWASLNKEDPRRVQYKLNFPSGEMSLTLLLVAGRKQGNNWRTTPCASIHNEYVIHSIWYTAADCGAWHTEHRPNAGPCCVLSAAAPEVWRPRGHSPAAVRCWPSAARWSSTNASVAQPCTTGIRPHCNNHGSWLAGDGFAIRPQQACPHACGSCLAGWLAAIPAHPATQLWLRGAWLPWATSSGRVQAADSRLLMCTVQGVALHSDVLSVVDWKDAAAKTCCSMVSCQGGRCRGGGHAEMGRGLASEG